MRVLVTGGAGYLGSTLSKYLLDKGHSVRVLDRLLFGSTSIQDLIRKPNFHLIEGDIRHLEDITAAMKDIDAVIDLAAIVGAPACDKNGETSIEVNQWATKLLADVASAHGVRRFLFASTCSVYGRNSGADLHEESDTNPLSLYAETKLQSESILLERNDQMLPVILRLATLCGPSKRMRFDLVLNAMTASACINQEITVHGGNQWRPLLDVRDAAESFILLLEKEELEIDNQIVNVGFESGNVTVGNLAKLIASEIDDSYVKVEPERTDPRSYKVNFERMNKLGFCPEVPLSQSVNDVADMIRENAIQDFRLPIYINSEWKLR